MFPGRESLLVRQKAIYSHQQSHMTTLRKAISDKQRHFESRKHSGWGFLWNRLAVSCPGNNILSFSFMQTFLAKPMLKEGKATRLEQYVRASLHKGSLENFIMNYEIQSGGEKVYCFRDINILEFRVHWQICGSLNQFRRWLGTTGLNQESVGGRQT